MTKHTARERQSEWDAWIAEHPMQYTTVTVTVAGETRTVQASTRMDLDTVHNLGIPGVVATIGRGSARYPDTLILHRLHEGQPSAHRGTVVTDSEGRKWTYHLETCVRNRQARIIGWADTAGVTNYQDQERA